MLPWQFLSSSLTNASQSLVGNANLISKVYFPRLIVPASAVMTAFVDLLISFALMIAIMAWYHFLPPWQIILLPLFIGLAFLTALGPGLFITALNVKYRDFRYIIPFLVQFGAYVSPVGFSSAVVPDHWRLLYSLESRSGRDRRLPLGASSAAPTTIEPALPGHLAHRHRLFPLDRHLLFSQDGTYLRRCDLMFHPTA